MEQNYYLVAFGFSDEKYFLYEKVRETSQTFVGSWPDRNQNLVLLHTSLLMLRTNHIAFIVTEYREA